MAQPKFTHVLFDMDGLLLDTERVYTEVTDEILSRFGHRFTWDIKSQMIGKKEQDAANLLVNHYKISLSPADYLAERNAKHEAKFPFCVPLPGVLRLVRHLKEQGIPIAVATSSHRKAFDLKSSRNGELFALFDGNVVCGDDSTVQNGKPAPDIFVAGAKKLGFEGPDFQQCLVFEDAPSGVLAGLNAGMRVVWIPDENLTVDPDLANRCVKVLKSMEEFDPSEFFLMPFK